MTSFLQPFTTVPPPTGEDRVQWIVFLFCIKHHLTLLSVKWEKVTEKASEILKALPFTTSIVAEERYVSPDHTSLQATGLCSRWALLHERWSKIWYFLTKGHISWGKVETLCIKYQCLCECKELEGDQSCHIQCFFIFSQRLPSSLYLNSSVFSLEYFLAVCSA